MPRMPEPLITIGQARELVLAQVRELGTEEVEIDSALGRILAHDVTAGADVPHFPSSAMDGYAITAGPAERRLAVTGESRAGAPAAGTVSDGEAIRVSTGAAVPEGATAVIRQEDTVAEDGAILTTAAIDAGTNIRRPGEDMRAGTTILQARTLLGPAELAAAVAAGAGRLGVTRRPVVSVLCTGDELRAPGERLGPGEIHNSNGPMLTGMAALHGAATLPAQRLPDDREATERGLDDALDVSDLVLISGGVSVGPHDHVKPALASLGVREHFWRVALQPGKPTWFGTRDRTLVFGLPGNPVSAAVTFTLFAAPALAGLLGRPPRAGAGKASLSTAVRRNPQREQAIRVRLQRRGAELLATPNGPQGSHIISSLIGADALAMIPPGAGELPAGTTVALERLTP